MPYPIKCTECGATLNTPNPIPPGKKVKCPKCKQVFTVKPEEEEEPIEEEVAAEEEEAAEEKPAPAPKKNDDPFGDDDEDEPRPKKKGKPADEDEDAADEEEEKPRKKGRGRRTDDDEKPKKKSSSLGLILGIIATVLLGCCGCFGIVGYFVSQSEDFKKAWDAGQKVQKEIEAKKFNKK